MATYVGTEQDDTFVGNDTNDTAEGKGGNDHLEGNGGSDVLAGDAGADYLDGGDGDDTLFSGSISPGWSTQFSTYPGVPPLLDTGAEVDTLKGGAGNDTLYGGYGDNIDGGSGSNYLLISFLGGPTGVTFNVNDLANVGSITVGGGIITNIRDVRWIQGSNFADTITAGYIYFSDCPIYGMGGDDTIVTGYYTSIVYGGDGNDHIDASRSAYGISLYGDAGDDVITGIHGNQIAVGGDGNDTLSGNGSGGLFGGAGNDMINVDPGDNSSNNHGVALGDDGDDIINGANGGDAIFGNAGADLIHGNDGDDLLYSGGAEPSDTFNILGKNFNKLDSGAEHDRIYGDAGNDHISIGYGDDADGGTGTNTLVLDLAGATSGVTLDAAGLIGGTVTLGGGVISNFQRVEAIWGSNFADTISLPTQGITATVYGGDGNDQISAGGSQVIFYGEAGDDTLTGGSAADTFHGGTGADVINGGGGDDIIYIDAAGDMQTGDRYDGGSGNDTLNVTQGGSFDISSVIISNIESLITGNNYYYTASMTASQLSGLQSLQVGDIKLTTSGAVQLAGINYSGSGTFTLSNDGNQLSLFGIGGDGGQDFVVNGGAAADTVTGSSGKDTIYGGGGDDIIQGGDGADRLYGGAGRDNINGGSGDDVIYINVGDSTAGEVIDGGDGTDTVTAGQSYLVNYADLTGTIFSNVENLSFTYVTLAVSQFSLFSNIGGFSVNIANGGNVSLSGITVSIGSINFSDSATNFDMSGAIVAGNADSTVNGGSGSDIITTIGANDTINGGAGDDIINSGAGADQLTGGTGRDIFHAGDGDDIIRVTAGDYAAGEIYDGGAGNDTLALANGIDISSSTLISIETLSFARDTTVSMTGAQLMSLAHFVMPGYIGGLVETINLTTGGTIAFSGTADYAIFNLAAPDTLFDLSAFVGEAAVNGNIGNDTIIGGRFMNMLTGGGGNDILVGGQSNDMLDGGSGADNLYGGQGNDTYHADRADDLVFENANEGTDTVIASAGFYLYGNIENLTLEAGAGDIFGVGNELANVMNGNEGSNLLIAGAGADVVHGGAGVDSLFGQDGNDQLFGDAGVDYLVGGNGDDMLDGGAGADALYGEGGNDVLWGGTDFQTDILVGGAGNDILHGDSGLGDYDLMDGGSGDDTYYVDTPADLTFEAVGGGTDTVHANIIGAGYYLYANVENLILDGVTPFGVGNELNNQLTGNAIGNYLLGGAGDDVLNGKAGNDVLFGESGADTFVFEHGTGADVIGDFITGTDKIDLTAIGYSWTQVQNSLHENGGNTAIDLGGGDLIVLNGVTAAQLHASDFILANAAQANGSAISSVAAPVNMATMVGLEGFQIGDDADVRGHLHAPTPVISVDHGMADTHFISPPPLDGAAIWL